MVAAADASSPVLNEKIVPTELKSGVSGEGKPNVGPRGMIGFLNNLSCLRLSDDPMEMGWLILEEIDDRVIEQGYW